MNDPEDDIACTFNDTLEALGLVQHVQFATHKLGNTLDLMITESSSKIGISACVPGMYISDHCSVECETTISKPKITVKRIKSRKLKDIDINQLIGEVKGELDLV